MQITLYSGFSKEMNSTKQPTGSGTTLDVYLKEPCSVMHPVFKVTGYNLSYNYIKWGSRYYYVDDIIIVHNDLAEYHCTFDAMATFKSEIGLSTQYILRSASAYDLNIIDTFYPIEASQTELAESPTQDPGWTHSISGGQFVIGVMGNSAGPNGGAVTYYAISSAGMSAITNYLLDETNYSGVTDITPDLLKCVFNPLEYIVSCLWFPFEIASLGTETINVGWWDITGVNATKLSSPIYTRNLSFNIPKHPQAATRGNYLNMQPYSKYVCNMGPWGVIPINNSQLIGETSLSFEMTVDLYTGSGRLSQVTSDVLAYAAEHTVQVGVPIQLGQNVLNQGALSNLTSGIGQIATGIATGGGGHILGGTITSIASVMELSQPTSTSMGSNGTIAFSTLFRLVGEFLLIADESLSKNGRPLCAPRQISTLSGFIQVHNADVDISGSPAEKNVIIGYMEGGFFYE